MDFRNILCSTCENTLSKLILKYHVSMLTHPSRISQNPFQNNKSLESSITTIYQSEISKIYIRWYLPFSQSVLFKISLYCTQGRWVVSFRGTYCLSSAYLILLHVCRFFFLLSFFLFFCGVYYLLRNWGKFVNTYNETIELFLGS